MKKLGLAFLLLVAWIVLFCGPSHAENRKLCVFMAGDLSHPAVGNNAASSGAHFDLLFRQLRQMAVPYDVIQPRR